MWVGFSFPYLCVRVINDNIIFKQEKMLFAPVSNLNPESSAGSKRIKFVIRFLLVSNIFLFSSPTHQLLFPLACLTIVFLPCPQVDGVQLWMYMSVFVCLDSGFIFYFYSCQSYPYLFRFLIIFIYCGVFFT